MKKINSRENARRRAIKLLYGAMIAMSCSLMAFEYTSFDSKTPVLAGDFGETIDIELPPIPTKPKSREKKKVLHKNQKKSPVVKPSEGDSNPEDGNTVDIDLGLDCDTCDWWMDETGDGDLHPVPFTIVQNMPCIPGCEHLPTNEERMMCTDRKIKASIASNIHYPQAALKNNIFGTVWVQYVIDTEGNVSQVKLLREQNPLLEKEAVRVVKLLPKHQPGSQRGMKVPVSYNIPINFVIKSNNR